MEKEKKGLNLKKTAKLAGTLIMIAALAFIVKKFVDMDIDPAQFREPEVIAALVIGMVIQTFIWIIACYPWLVFTRSLSGRKIPFSEAMPVYTQSNIYKYLPGNVLQYVGRNALASKMGISHVDVACATILDIIFCIIAAGLVSVILLGDLISGLLGKYGTQILIVGSIGIAVLAAAAAVLYLKFRDRFRSYLSRYAKAFEKGNRIQLIKGILYYLVQNVISAVMYFIALKLIFGNEADFNELVSYTGAFLFAWIIGFITIGAPGGIGVREGVMIFVCGDKYADKIILFVLVMRIASTLADVIAFVFGKTYLAVKNYGSAEHKNI